MNGIIKTKTISKTWEEAHISLYSESLDSTDMKNSRSFSLLNENYKVFARILVGSLKKCLMKYIKEEQAGFVLGRQIRGNIRVVINAVEYYDKRQY